MLPPSICEMYLTCTITVTVRAIVGGDGAADPGRGRRRAGEGPAGGGAEDRRLRRARARGGLRRAPPRERGDARGDPPRARPAGPARHRGLPAAPRGPGDGGGGR